ncbi:hypothetical protein [Candidatus Ferrigenium straubiae]|jgi:hypothetical protein|uniref:hypothetical protein n=1 Tax=Candidatus Ferrigenium straubiae TaxID=2919506 RepID=UPI003F4A9D71
MKKVDGNSKSPDVRLFELTELDVEAAQSLGIVLAGTADDCISRAISAQNSALRLALEAGYLLLKARADIPHGEFIKHVEARGLAQQRASELMRMARFYTATPPERRAQLVGMSKSKLMLLADADQEVIEDILDDPEGELESLSVRGLRQRITELGHAKNNEAIRANNAERKAADLLKKNRITQFTPFTEEVRAEVMALQREAELPIDGLLALFERAALGYDGSVEARLRVEHIWIAANAVLARAADAVALLKEQAPDALPDRLQSQHYLTPEEAAEWRRIGQEIQSSFEGRKVVRQQERAAEQPRKPGRPPKAKPKGGEA